MIQEQLHSLDDVRFMRLALVEAKKAYEIGEIPVGCVIVADNQIVGRGHNLTETLQDITAHAEMQAITAAMSTLGGKYLNDCTLYVTVEPCVMCAGALFWSQIGRVVFGADDPKRGATRINQRIYHPKTVVDGGVMRDECAEVLKSFFNEKR